MRIRANFADGTLTVACDADDTVLASAEFAALPVVAGGDHLALIIEPESPTPEVVWVTAHTASSTTVTVTRAQEGTTAAAHVISSDWTHAPTVKDFPEPTIISLGSIGRIYISSDPPDEPEEGDYWFESIEEFIAAMGGGGGGGPSTAADVSVDPESLPILTDYWGEILEVATALTAADDAIGSLFPAMFNMGQQMVLGTTPEEEASVYTVPLTANRSMMSMYAVDPYRPPRRLWVVTEDATGGHTMTWGTTQLHGDTAHDDAPNATTLYDAWWDGAGWHLARLFPVVLGDSNVIGSDGSILHAITITQADYDLLSPPDPETLYVIVEEA